MNNNTNNMNITNNNINNNIDINSKSYKRIKEEYEDLVLNPIKDIGLTIELFNKNNIYEWKITMFGPKDTSYSGGLFFLKAIFPKDYPYTPPEVCFVTPIYHLNVNPKKKKKTYDEHLGHICISTINWWKPQYKMKEIIINIFGLFYMCNPGPSYDCDRAEEYNKNKKKYEDKIKYFTKKYANPSIPYKEYNSDWDFSYSQ